MKGIDVSRWQGQIDFNAVKKSGVEFVIIQAGYGKSIRQKDPCFEQNYTRAKAAGLKVGAYWFSYAHTPDEAVLEARTCAEAIKGKQFDFPIYFDLENDRSSNYYPFITGKSNCSSMVKAFCTELEKLGYFVGLYISRSPLQNYITKDVATRFALWIAEYGSKLNYTGQYGIWQKSNSGRVVGVIGDVDIDEAVVDYSEIIKSGGFNGYPKTNKPKEENPKDEKPVPQPAPEQPEQPKYIDYKIKKGDTLTAIAKAHGTTIAELKKLNNIKNVNLIYAGDVIKIPVRG